MKVELRAVQPEDAIAFFRQKGFAPPDARFDFRDVWRDQHARSFVVAKAMRQEVLETIRTKLDDAVTGGQTLAQFTAGLEPELKRLGWWGRSMERDPLTGELKNVQLGSPRRLEVIFHANMRAAHAAGQWARIQRVKDAFPFLRYIQIQRRTKREEHARYHQIILPVDHPAWERIFPPNGWFCGCTVQQINQRMMDARGWKVTENFRLQERGVLNKRTGEVEPTALGVDPAWDGNPGREFLDISRTHGATTDGLPEAVISAERGLAAQVRLMGMGDGRERLAMIDMQTGAEIDTSTGNGRTVKLSGEMKAALRQTGQELFGLVHNHPSSRPLSPKDIATLFANEGLTSVLAVGHDGSVYRAIALRVPDFDLVEAATTAAQLVDLGADRLLSRDQRDHAIRAVLLRALNLVGMIRYRESLGAQAQAERDGIADIVAAGAERLAELM